MMEDIDITDLARRTHNFSGSDLKNLAVSAALESLKESIPDMWNARKTSEKESAQASSDKSEGHTEDAGADDDSDSDDNELASAPRILRPIHFKAAFEHVSATSSRDMASVQKLRNWAAQFSRGGGTGSGVPFAETSSTPTRYADLGASAAFKTASTTRSSGSAGVTLAGMSSPTTHRGLGIGSKGSTLWDDQYEANALSRFSNLPGLSGSGSKEYKREQPAATVSK